MSPYTRRPHLQRTVRKTKYQASRASICTCTGTAVFKINSTAARSSPILATHTTLDKRGRITHPTAASKTQDLKIPMVGTNAALRSSDKTKRYRGITIQPL
ncbi:protein of unknown function (plasmid) [Cupriavidus taiwanensis]|nr:hypothetical protein CBM2614_U10005 [Cupriavidus taiwanensis]SPA03678.1 protein of unknown function [Cupriavidus taiwanensis]SPA57481.1 protein of unknown function [Cupriavidus taiwanensis]